MLDKWKREIEGTPQNSMFDQMISFCVLYHPSDKAYWKRLYQHFQVMSQQFCRIRPGWRTDWHIHMLDPRILQQSQVYDDIARAHIVITLFSVDSVLILQESEALYRSLSEKAIESYHHVLQALVQPPYVKGILIKPVSWDEGHLDLNSFQGVYQAIAGSKNHDDLYTIIAQQIRECTNKTHQFLVAQIPVHGE